MLYKKKYNRECRCVIGKMKIRFIEPGNRSYRKSILNYIVYDRYIRTPSVGLNTLATIVKSEVSDLYVQRIYFKN